MDSEDHMSILMKDVNYSKKEWQLLINCAMAGKPAVKKYTDDVAQFDIIEIFFSNY